MSERPVRKDETDEDELRMEAGRNVKSVRVQGCCSGKRTNTYATNHGRKERGEPDRRAGEAESERKNE